jgi:uncharacterized integral membrane protein (TIGR00697 family)
MKSYALDKGQLLPYLFAALAGTLVISNVLVGRVTQIGPFVLTLSDFIFPVVYLLSDLVSELYGKKLSRKITYAAIVVNIVYAALANLGTILPILPDDTTYQIYNGLSTSWRFVAASILALHFGDLVNDHVFQVIKNKVPGNNWRYYLRSIGSSIPGNIVDSWVFAIVAFAGTLPFNEIFAMSWTILLLKFLIETILFPINNAIVNRINRTTM